MATSVEHWTKVTKLLDGVLRREPAARARYLDTECAGDTALRSEVERLLALGQAPSFLDTGALVFAAPLLDAAGAIVPHDATAGSGTPYRLEKRLARGGMATVYLAHDTKHDRRVAVKVLHPDLTVQLEAERFVREIRLTARLQHPHVLALLDSGVFASPDNLLSGRPYYVMPFVEGESLRACLARGDSLGLREIIRLLREVADALSYAHGQGVIHRDIKPENILMSGGHAVVADFGIAKALFAAQANDGGAQPPSSMAAGPLRELSTRVGTPAYMAPEQAAAKPSVDHRADIYSFGCMAYELLSGSTPFPKGPVSEVLAAHVARVPTPLGDKRPDCPPALSTLVARCLHKDPSRRPQSAAELVTELDAIAAPRVGVRFAVRTVRRASWLVAIGIVAMGTVMLRPRLDGSGMASPVHMGGTADPEAFDEYQRGQYLLRRRGTGVKAAAEHFERAIARDSTFAAAYAALGSALVLFPYFAETPPSAIAARATAAAHRALLLDSTLGEPHTALAIAAMHAHRWARADSEHRKALALMPGDASAHHQYGRYLLFVGLLDSALAEFQRARAGDPLSSLYSAWTAYSLDQQGKTAQARQEVSRALELDSLNIVALMQAIRVFVSARDSTAASKLVERLPNTPPWIGDKAYFMARLGKREPARRIMRTFETRTPRVWFGDMTIALAALGLGDTAKALDALEQATKDEEIWAEYRPVWDPMFDPIRRSTRFDALLQRLDLRGRPTPRRR